MDNIRKEEAKMNQNGFREEELVTRRLNGQTRVFPVVGGRLRLAHEENDNLSLETELMSWDGQYAVFRCKARTKKGDFAGYGTANSQRDARLSESLIELAETRSIPVPSGLRVMVWSILEPKKSRTYRTGMLKGTKHRAEIL